MKRVILKVFGQVQGVFFRAFVKEKARELSLGGWARNTADGMVEVLAEGDEESLKKLIGYCKKGPEFAKIDEVEVKWEEAIKEFSDFEIRR